MPNLKGNRRVQEQEEKKIRRERSGGKILRPNSLSIPTQDLLRPKTVPELLPERNIPMVLTSPKFTKLLLNVTIQRSLGTIHVVMSPKDTVGDLIAAVLRQYDKEGRRPVLPLSDPLRFDLHYTQFTLQNLNREEKLIDLVSRNFFLCPAKKGMGDCGGKTMPCCKEAGKISSEMWIPWLKFIFYLF